MNMLLEQFKTIFDRPEKVKKLRQYILQLAVTGRLVEQHENDEPASVLLEKIKEKKERLIKEKKIKKQKALPEISEDEIPYELPKGWEWVRLGEIIELISGRDVSVSLCNNKGLGIPYILGASNIKENKFCVERWIENPVVVSQIGDLLISCKGTVGKTIIIDQEINLSRQIMALRSVGGLNIQYLKLFTDDYVSILNNMSKGLIPGISRDDILKIRFPLPPLNEQKQIVKKVDYLMLLCDKLEEHLESKAKYGALSSKSVFNSIGNCKSSDELEEVLKFIIMNFKELTLGDDAVKELKNAILQLAVQGKLVSQDKNDEPASVLLEKIKEEKERLVEEKKIKKQKSLPEISEDEIPYELPKGWEWTRLGECSLINPRNSLEDDKEVSFIPMKLISDGFDNRHDSERRVWSDIKKGFTHFAENDVVVAKITPCFENRKSAIMKNLIGGYGAGTTELYVIRSIGGYVLPEYILNICKTSNFIKDGVETYTGTAGQQRVKKGYISNLVIPIPPLNEQKRIVEKVDSLMALCNELEKRIENSKRYSEKLMESILKE